MSNKKSNTWMALAGGIMAILLAAYFIGAKSEKFNVKYFQSSQIEGYEAKPATVEIYPSAAITFTDYIPAQRILGWLLFFAIPIICYRKRDSVGEKWVVTVVLACMLGTGICWFARHGAKLSETHWTGSYQDFVTTFDVSDDVAEKVVAEGGSGQLNIKDESGLITEYFTGK